MSDLDEVCYEQEEEEQLVVEEAETQQRMIHQHQFDPPAAQVNAESSSPPAAPLVPLFDCVKELLTDPRIGYHEPKPSQPIMKYGWFWPSHQVMFDCLLSDSTKVIVELGAFLGKSTSYFLSKCPSAVVFAVDLWDNNALRIDPQYKTADQQVISSYPLYETFLSNTWKRHVRLKDKHFTGLIPCRMDTVEALTLMHAAGLRPDCIYVDANHMYTAVLQDVRTCVTLFPASVVCGNDYDNANVKMAVNKVANELGLKVLVVQNKCWTYAAIDEAELERSRRNVKLSESAPVNKKARVA